jgi:threonine dehydratase
MVMEERILLEGASAMAVAAVRDYPDVVGGSNVAIVISGGNVDGKRLAEVLNEEDDSLEL